MKSQIPQYKDTHFEFRRAMLRNLYYLRNMPDEVINELINHLVVKRYAKGVPVIKSGDVSKHLYFIRQGEIEIYVNSLIRVKSEKLLIQSENLGVKLVSS